MTRRSVIFTALFGLACGKPPKKLDDVFPPELGGGWKRGNVTPITETPALIGQAGPLDSAQSEYTGPAGRVAVQVFRMKAETSAFELRQKWRPDDGIATYKGPLFFVARGEKTPPNMVMSLLSELVKSSAAQ